MKIARYSVLAFLVLLCCRQDEEIYPPEPVITFTSIEFFDPLDPSERDSLVLTFSFTDGDFDFGLDPEHVSPPFNGSFFIHKITGGLITSDKFENKEIDAEQLIRYSDRQTPPFDTLPALGNWCFYYFTPPNDYLYGLYNENFSNLFIDFFYEDGDGDFVEFDFLSAMCQTFDSRVFTGPGAHGPFIKKMNNSKSGTIKYFMVDFNFKAVFEGKRMKVKFFIQDRALNRSNIAETPEFYLSEI